MQSDKHLENSLIVLILNDTTLDYIACPLEPCMALKKTHIYLLKALVVSKVNLAHSLIH
jgi:hypothetical protein